MKFLRYLLTVPHRIEASMSGGWTILTGHDFNHLMWLPGAHRAEKVRCRRCDRLFAVNHTMEVYLEWDKEFEQFYFTGHASMAEFERRQNG